ncbi:reverse transcriptase domain-containing protein [Trichonephila clavipes]|nr:reverse transcriptase domain-containing protein [Trichonephila clavipes]
MDDIVSGAPDLETAQQLQSQLKDALQSCGMNLHKWSSNSPELLNSSLSSDVSVSAKHICGMQPKAKHSLRAQAQLMRTETVETFELVKGEPKLFKRGERRATERLEPIDKYSACVEVGTHRRKSACVEVGSTHINTCEEVSIRTISTILPAKR